MPIDKERLIDSLYTRCSDRTLTSEQVFAGLVKDLGLIGVSQVEDRAMLVIRPYKQTGKHLERTCDALYNLLQPDSNPNPESEGTGYN